jgi:Mn-dependent DtxR family transcriptional regulator
MKRGREKTMTPVLEDYLKAIFTITEEKPVARVKDIAEIIGVSLPSVTNALKRLKDLGYVEYEKYGLIMLSEKGYAKAQSLKKVNEFVQTFFSKLVGLDAKESASLSCRVEHFFEGETYDRIEQFINILLKVKAEGISACQELVDFLKNTGDS